MITHQNALRPLTEDPDMRITLTDGCTLSCRVWMPQDATDDPVPVILEYLPYRKRDGTCARDALTHPWFAERGYACVRVDMRGNGDSEGVMLDEYAPQELADAVEVIHWLASQPWCNGKIGMMGISWGGFNQSRASNDSRCCRGPAATQQTGTQQGRREKRHLVVRIARNRHFGTSEKDQVIRGAPFAPLLGRAKLGVEIPTARIHESDLVQVAVG